MCPRPQENTLPSSERASVNVFEVMMSRIDVDCPKSMRLAHFLSSDMVGMPSKKSSLRPHA